MVWRSKRNKVLGSAIIASKVSADLKMFLPSGWYLYQRNFKLRPWLLTLQCFWAASCWLFSLRGRLVYAIRTFLWSIIVESKLLDWDCFGEPCKFGAGVLRKSLSALSPLVPIALPFPFLALPLLSLVLPLLSLDLPLCPQISLYLFSRALPLLLSLPARASPHLAIFLHEHVK